MRKRRASVAVSTSRIEAMRSNFPPFRLRFILRRRSRTARNRWIPRSSRTAVRRRASPASRPGRTRPARIGASRLNRETPCEIGSIHPHSGRYARTPRRHADQPSSWVQIRLDRMVFTIFREEVGQCLLVQPHEVLTHVREHPLISRHSQTAAVRDRTTCLSPRCSWARQATRTSCPSAIVPLSM
jgi:hypothetical protein